MTKETNFLPSQNTKDEIKAIKEDIQDIFMRIGNMKEDSLKAFSDDYEQLLTKMYSMKDKIVGNDTFRALDIYIQRHPVKSAIYCLGLGMLIAKCFKK